MKIAVVGLGKLGLPVAQAMQKHHDVMGWDIDSNVRERITTIPLIEPSQMIDTADITFVAVQTPHQEQFDGTHPLPDIERADFDYTYLLDALTELNYTAEPKATVAVISTCLPGTLDRIVKYFPNLNIIYNPMFVGMGRVERDYLDPKFILLGGPDVSVVRDFYVQTHSWISRIETDYITAEAIKVSYNTFITAKTVLANTWGEICHKLNVNVDELYNVWALDDERLIGTQYLEAGMSDGGPCHPRDNIALSWLSNKLGLKHNYFDSLMKARQAHEEFLISLLPQGERVTIFGRSFKPKVQLEDGSPAVLMANLLRERGHPFIHRENPQPGLVNFIATKHERYKNIEWPKGSTVIDPFGIIADQEGVNVIRVGRK